MFVIFLIAGVACHSNHLCGYHGYSYVWCYVDYYDNWHYCAHDPNDNLNNIIDSEVDNVREEVSSDLSQITRRLEELESRLVETDPREPFTPDVTIIIVNLAPVSANETEAAPVGAKETETALMDKIHHILAEGLALPDIEPMAVTRLAPRGKGPGLVLLELGDVEDKITVMNAKQSLRNKDEYKNLDLRTAEGHTDRLMRLNFNTLLSNLHRKREFWFTVSGRLVPRDGTHGSSGESAGHLWHRHRSIRASWSIEVPR